MFAEKPVHVADGFHRSFNGRAAADEQSAASTHMFESERTRMRCQERHSVIRFAIRGERRHQVADRRRLRQWATEDEVEAIEEHRSPPFLLLHCLEVDARAAGKQLTARDIAVARTRCSRRTAAGQQRTR